MSRRRGVLALALCAVGALLSLFSPSSARAETIRLGLFIGNNIGFGEDEPLLHAEREARDMARIFNDMGGLARDRTRLIQGQSAQVLQDELARAEAHIAELRADGHQVLLLFFYSGHASRDGLHMSGSMMPMDALRGWLERSTAQVRIAFVDACEAGSLARVRGGVPVESVEVTVDDLLTTSGLAVVTSTGPLSVARESDSFGGGVFSQALLSGLRGSADRDADGRITLDEAYAHAFAETVAGTAASADAVQLPEYRFELSGVGEVVLTRTDQRAAGLVLPEELEGVYTVVSVETGQVVARVDKTPGELRRLSLPTGRYLVRKVRREDVLLAELDLVWGGDRWVEDNQMSVVPVGDPLVRGGWTSRPLALSMRLTGATPPVGENPLMLGGELQARIRLRPTLGLIIAGQYGQGFRWAWGGRIRTGALQVRAGLVFERSLRRLDLRVGGGGELIYLHQLLQYAVTGGVKELDTESDTAAQLTGGAFAQMGIHVPVGPVVGLEAGARVHFYSVDVDGQNGFFVMGQAFLGVGFRIGGRRISRAGVRN